MDFFSRFFDIFCSILFQSRNHLSKKKYKFYFLYFNLILNCNYINFIKIDLGLIKFRNLLSFQFDEINEFLKASC
jgi:hypothetical protein